MDDRWTLATKNNKFFARLCTTPTGLVVAPVDTAKIRAAFTRRLSPWVFARLRLPPEQDRETKANGPPLHEEKEVGPSFCVARELVPPKREGTAAGRELEKRKSAERALQRASDLPAAFAHLEQGDVSREMLLQILSTVVPAQQIQQVSEDSIAGLTQVRKLIRDKVINPFKRPDLHRGLHRAARGILLFGPPGTGKTLIARWIASETSATFFDVSPASLISKWFGETESLAKALFLCADAAAPAVVFIDEIDALLGKRRDGEDEGETRMKNQLLTLMDGLQRDEAKSVVVIGATNRPQALDAAAIRRLPRRVLVPLPDEAARAGIMERVIERHHAAHKLEAAAAVSSFGPSEARAVAKLLEGWSASDVVELCAKAADFAYDDALQQYGGRVEAIPRDFVFRPVAKEDFSKALECVRPAASADATEEMLRWAREFGTV